MPCYSPFFFLIIQVTIKVDTLKPNPINPMSTWITVLTDVKKSSITKPKPNQAIEVKIQL